jgi:toxin HigB-1
LSIVYKGDIHGNNRTPGFLSIDIAHYTCYHANVIDFYDQGTEDIFEGVNSKEARKTCPNNLWKTACRKLDMINYAQRLSDLKVPPGNHLEPLNGDRAGQYSININDQYRICFIWTEKGAERVEITDYH